MRSALARIADVRVFLTPTAEAELVASFNYLRRQAPLPATYWLRRILDSVQSLRTMPERCGRAEEADLVGEDIRELLFGRGRGTFRILFVINSGVVWVRHIRRASRGPIPADEF